MNRKILEAWKEAGVIQDYWFEGSSAWSVVPVKAVDHIKLNLVVSDDFKGRRENMTEELLFATPKFQAGINFTVRHGTKWADRVNVGDVVKLQKLGNSVIVASGQLFEDVLGRITHVIKCKLRDLPDMVLFQEHDSNCRQMKGLIEALEEVYPFLGELKNHRKDIMDEVVTALGFVVYAKIPRL